MGVKVDFKVNVPHGEMDITENGQYDVSDYAVANVNVAFETEEKSVTITENGAQEVLPSVGKDALSKVVINTEIPIKEEQSKNVEIKENGTISVLPDEGKVLNEVSITTNVPQDNTLKKLLDATKSCYYLFKDYKGTSVDDLIQPNDTENVTNMANMFSECSKLTSIPQLSTGNVTNMYGMFSSCSALITIPQLNTSKVDNMNNIFSACSSLESIPLLDTSKVKNMSQMFWHCNNLQTVPAFDCSDVTNMNNTFASCKSLKSVLMTNIGVSLDISASTLFERADLVTILNNLKTVTTTKTLKMGATNLAKLTDEDKAIATNKGWTLA
jgi:surface protein